MTTPPAAPRRPSLKKSAGVVLALLLVYFVVAYVIVPMGWISYARRHPAWENAPRITHTGADIPGDPLNVALIGTETEVKHAMLAAEWYPADPLTFRSCLEIAEASVLKRKYRDAPVSNLFLMGRKQDLAFEQPVGDNPRKRHHVRFWKWDQLTPEGRPVWFGSATFDERVGLSHTTGEITHHVAPEIDAERDHVVNDLKQAGELIDLFTVVDFHKAREGRNGGGDPWRTDGSLKAGVLRAGGTATGLKQ